MIRTYLEQHAFGTGAVLHSALLPFLRHELVSALPELLPVEMATDYVNIISKHTDDGVVEGEKRALISLDYWSTLQSFVPHIGAKQDFDLIINLIWTVTYELCEMSRTLNVSDKVKQFAAQMASRSTVEESTVNYAAKTFVDYRVSTAIQNQFQNEDGDGDVMVSLNLRKSYITKFSEFIKQSIRDGSFFDQDFANAGFELTDDGNIVIVGQESGEVALDGDEWEEIIDG